MELTHFDLEASMSIKSSSGCELNKKMILQILKITVEEILSSYLDDSMIKYSSIHYYNLTSN